VDFELSSAEKAFRDEVRAWLKINAPRDDGDLETSEFIDNRRAWQKKLHEAGYVGILAEGIWRPGRQLDGAAHLQRRDDPGPDT